MTYSSDPHHTNPRHRERGENQTAIWIVAAVAAIAVIGGIVYATSDGSDQTASNPPAATTGTGTTPPAPPANTAPTTPAPAPANR